MAFDSNMTSASVFCADLRLPAGAGAFPFPSMVRFKMSPAFFIAIWCQHSLIRLRRLSRFMLLQSTIELSGLPIGVKEIPSSLGCAERGADNQAVG